MSGRRGEAHRVVAEEGHDRFLWVPPQEAVRRCGPQRISEAPRAVIAQLRRYRQYAFEQAAWIARTRKLLERSYPQAGDVFGGSGFDGDASRWRHARRVILEAVNGDGTFLDVGCANGLLMESVATWAGEEGQAVEPYGLELLPAVAQTARRRLPAWADRVFVGDVTTWEPPRRFDFVRTELDYVPPGARQRLVQRCLDDLVAPGGRLVVCSYGSTTRPHPRAEPVGTLLEQWGFAMAGQTQAVDANGVVITRVAWTDRVE